MAISPVNANTPVMPMQSVGTDSDGDKDASKTAAPSAPPTPPVSKPTATMGNTVNTYA